jgi:hypothetical protein
MVTPPEPGEDLTDPASIRDRTLFVTGIGDDFSLVNDLDLAEGRQPAYAAAEVLAPASSSGAQPQRLGR